MLYKHVQVPTVAEVKGLQVAEYDFAVQGGAISSITMAGCIVPDNAIVIRTWVEILTTLDSAAEGASIAITLGGSNVVASAVEASWGAGLVEGIQAGAVANALKMTADTSPLLVISGEALTSGKCRLYVEYVQSI